jgi:hypothetical protein
MYWVALITGRGRLAVKSQAGDEDERTGGPGYVDTVLYKTVDMSTAAVWPLALNAADMQTEILYPKRWLGPVVLLNMTSSTDKFLHQNITSTALIYPPKAAPQQYPALAPEPQR